MGAYAIINADVNSLADRIDKRVEKVREEEPQPEQPVVRTTADHAKATH